MAKWETITAEQVWDAFHKGCNTKTKMANHFKMSSGDTNKMLNRLNLVFSNGALCGDITVALKRIDNINKEEDWVELYNEYNYCTQAQFLISACKIDKKMNVAEAREWMKNNFTYTAIEVNYKTTNIQNKLERICRIKKLHGFIPTWAAAVFKEAKENNVEIPEEIKWEAYNVI